MGIGEVCSREVVFVNRDVTVHAACRLMRHYHVGSLVVVDDHNGTRVPVGMITDRDIVLEVNAMDLDTKTITAGDIMSSELYTAQESAGVAETIRMMRAKGVRRLPVVNEDHRLVGIVTVDDLLELLAETLSGMVRILAREQTREAVARK